MFKKGEISVEYVIVFIIALLLLTILLIYSGNIKDKIIEGFKVFGETLFGLGN